MATTTITIETSEILNALSMQFYQNHIVECSELLRDHKSANGLASAAHKLDEAGLKDESDAIYADYEKRASEVHEHKMALVKKFYSENSYLFKACAIGHIRAQKHMSNLLTKMMNKQ